MGQHYQDAPSHDNKEIERALKEADVEEFASDKDLATAVKKVQIKWPIQALRNMAEGPEKTLDSIAEE